MKLIDKNTKEYYLSRRELQAMIFGSKKNADTGHYSWIEVFDKGDILHIKEGNGQITTMVVEVVKQLVHLI